MACLGELRRRPRDPDGNGPRMLKLTWPRVAAWRVRRHQLDQRAPAGSMLAVASRLCGLHAQVMSSAELTVWARVENLDRRAIQRALWEDRTLVKTWAMRGTLHLLPADELSLWHAALSTSQRYRKAAALQKYFGITLDQLDRITEAVGAALEGRVMTREELVKEVKRLTGSAVRRQGCAEQLGHHPEAGRVHRPPVLRTQPRSARALHLSGYLADLGTIIGRSANCARRRPPFPGRLRSGHLP